VYIAGVLNDPAEHTEMIAAIPATPGRTTPVLPSDLRI